MNVPVAPEPPKKPEKDNTWKWLILGCFGFIVLFGVTGGVIGYKAYKSFNTSPAEVEAAAQQILTFEKPEGYKGTFSMSIMGITMAGLSGDSSANILLMTMPQNNRDQLRRQMNSQVETQRSGQHVQIQNLPAETFKVRGEDVPAEVQKLTPDQGSATLQYTLFVTSSKKQLVMIHLAGAEKTMTHDWVQKFLDTVR